MQQWQQDLSELFKNEKAADAPVLDSLHACVYIANTRTLAWPDDLMRLTVVKWPSQLTTRIIKLVRINS